VPIRRRVVVRGRVQGVFFRHTTAQLARRLRVSGWIRNRADGTVEAAFEGDAEAVERLVAACRKGPPGAAVEAVDVVDEEPEGPAGFDVR
jgi:acylphosphatase